MKLHNALYHARERKKLSLRELQKITGIPHASLSQIETGYVSNPSWRSVVKISRALGLSLNRLAETE